MSLARFLRRSEGSTPFALLWFAMLAILSGLAIDVSNAWRTEQALAQAASAAAHAGVVALAGGAPAETIREAAAAAAIENLPGATRDSVLRSLPQDIRLLRFDPVTGRAAPADDPDAVLVELHRSAATENPVRFLMLQLVGAFLPGAREEWEISAHGMAAITGRAACAAADGIYSEGQLDISSAQVVGANVCFHGQDGVWMPQANSFQLGSVVSMPDLESCLGKCEDAANPGASAAAREVNLLPFGVAGRIAQLRADFLTDGGGHRARDFFAGKPVVPGPLHDSAVAAGLLAGMPQPGAVIRLSAPDFEILQPRITGVTYEVGCAAGAASPLVALLTGKPGQSNARRLTLDGEVRNIAIVTDCAVHVADGAEIRGALIVTTEAKSGVSAGSFARIGADSCAPGDRSTLATGAELRVPAGFAGSNLDILVDGDVHFAAASAAGTLHRGLNLMASGDVHLSAGHTFRACGTAAPLAPGPRLIREVALSPAG